MGIDPASIRIPGIRVVGIQDVVIPSKHAYPLGFDIIPRRGYIFSRVH